MAKIPPSIKDKFRNPAIGVTKFKPPAHIRNRILYGLMLVEGISSKELASRLKPARSQRAVQRWISHGSLPSDITVVNQVSKILKCPPHVLFGEVSPMMRNITNLKDYP